MTFALYVIVTGIYDLILKIYNKIKNCKNNGESRQSVAAIDDAIDDVVSIRSNKTFVTSILNKSGTANNDISLNKDDDEYQEHRHISTSRNDRLFLPARRQEWYDFVIE